MSRQKQLTEEQVALSNERKRKRAQLAAASQDGKKYRVLDDQGQILQRRWLQDESAIKSSESWQQVKLMTWNMLAQTLVRRELFPNSDCLKAAQREQMLYNEIVSSGADILCLQEVDRLEKLLPILKGAGYAHAYAAGPNKKHGCIIAYRDDMYEKLEEQTVFYDAQEIRAEGSDHARKGASFLTRNIGFLVQLKRHTPTDEYLIVGTTHLFWHPRYTYERSRQAYILVREVTNFRHRLNMDRWPCVIAGDFNFPPNDATYSLLVGDELLPEQQNSIEVSRVVHKTMDPEGNTENGEPTEEDESTEKDPDKIITNARVAKSSDGLLQVPELVDLFGKSERLLSIYDAWVLPQQGLTFGSRVNVPANRRGHNEPKYTSYTHYWKAVLDYIFVMNPPSRTSKVLALKEVPSETEFSTGLPRKGICGSDHISLMASIAWSPVGESSG